MSKKEIGRIAAIGYYGFQQVRIANKNQMRNIIYKLVEGIGFTEVEDKKEDKDYSGKYADKELIQKLEQLLKDEEISKKHFDYVYDCWTTITGGKRPKKTTCPHCKKKFDDTEKITGIQQIENEYKKLMKRFVKTELIYQEFLSKIRGVGEIHSANLIKSFGYCELEIYKVTPATKKTRRTETLIAKERDPHFQEVYEMYLEDIKNPIEERKYHRRGYNTVSQLWVHTGNHVVDGIAPRLRKGQEVNFNPKLRTMTWLIGESLMKLNHGYYRKQYETYRETQTNRVYPIGFLAENYNGYKYESTQLSIGHTHARALRKIRKLFLSHYWEAARELMGLSIEKTYVEGVLKHDRRHIVSWRDVVAMENTHTTKKVEKIAT